jgi:hypothetical protein
MVDSESGVHLPTAFWSNTSRFDFGLWGARQNWEEKRERDREGRR